jgi:NADH-quinone oxidoreductase subunit N
MTKWTLFGPELFFMASALVLLGLSMHRHGKRAFGVSMALSAAGAALCLAAVRLEGPLFFDTYRIDLFSQVFKTLLSMGLFLVVCLCGELRDVPEKRRAEFFALLFTATLALMLLVSSVHLLTLFVSLELSSYALYVLTAMRRRRDMAVEATLKFFVTGVTASAVMLFGLALVYGATGAADLAGLARVLPAALADPLTAVGMLMTFCGFFFKLAVFPFHYWAPDVYQGASHQAAAFIATASKVAAIAILIRVAAPAGGSDPYLVQALLALSVVSMTLGNLSAIAQKDLKRLLAYSSVAHAGYVLIGILSMNDAGYAAAVFYAAAVLAMKFTCFLVVVKVAGDGDNPGVADLAGLHRRSPILALALMMALFGLAGIPPTVGFTGKLLLFTAAMERGYLLLILIAMANVLVSLYYYLIVLKAAYLLEPETPAPAMAVSLPERLLAAGLVAFIVIAGIYPGWLVDVAREAVAGMM